MSSFTTPLKPLKFFLNFIFIVVIASVALNIIGILFIPIFPQSKILLDILGITFFRWEFPVIALIITSILLNLGFIFSLHVFKRIVSSLFESELFNRFQISSLNLLGQLIILLVILKSIHIMFSNIVYGKSEDLGIHIFSFDSKFMAICMGLFMIYLSYIFKKAKSLKEENDLTV